MRRHYRRFAAITVALIGLSAGLSSAGVAATWALPDSALTPGAVGKSNGSSASIATVCVRGYGPSIRHRYDREWLHYRTAMFREYGIPHDQWRYYRVDHVIPLELDGRPYGTIAAVGSRPVWDLRNVWPEPVDESYEKNAVENALRAAVCDREGYHGLHLSLMAAQRAIAHDWTGTLVGLPAVTQNERDE